MERTQRVAAAVEGDALRQRNGFTLCIAEHPGAAAEGFQQMDLQPAQTEELSVNEVLVPKEHDRLTGRLTGFGQMLSHGDFRCAQNSVNVVLGDVPGAEKAVAVVGHGGDGESAQHGEGQRVIPRPCLGEGELLKLSADVGTVLLRFCQKKEQQGEGFVLFDSGCGGFVVLQQAVKHPVPLM